MASYVKFTLEDGTEVFVESIDVSRSTGGLIPPARESAAASATVASFEQSFLSVRKMAAVMLNDLRDGFTVAPEEVNISFGLKASAELGTLIVARGGMEANFNVNLRWRSKEEETAKPSEPAAETKPEAGE